MFGHIALGRGRERVKLPELTKLATNKQTNKHTQALLSVDE